jgi:hypothetical protein
MWRDGWGIGVHGNGGRRGMEVDLDVCMIPS